MSVIRYVFTHYGSDEKIESHIESDNLWEQKPHNRIEMKEIAVLICWEDMHIFWKYPIGHLSLTHEFLSRI